MNEISDSKCLDIRNQFIAGNLSKLVKFTVLFSLAIIPLLVIPIKSDLDTDFIPKVVAMLIIVLSFIIMLIKNKWSIRSIVKNDGINKILLVYLTLLIISIFFAFNKVYAIFGAPGRYEGIITIILYMNLFLIARLYIKIDEKFLHIILISASIASIYGILQSFGIEPLPMDEERANWVSAFSTFGNPNYLGSYLVLMIPVALYLFVNNKNIIGLVGYMILFYCLLCTNTRGAWLGYIISMIFFAAIHFIYFRYSKEEFIRYTLLFVVTIILLLLYNIKTDGAFIGRFLTISSDAKELLAGGERADFTGAHRGFIWRKVVELIRNRPITGYGLENLGEMFVKYFSQDMIQMWGKVRYPDKAHNEYLHIAVTSGIPSLIIYLIFLASVIFNGIKSLANNKNMLLFLSSIIGYIVAAFFNISIVSVAYIFWIFLGLTVSYSQKGM